MKLRDYQEYAVDSIFRYFAEGGDGNPIVAMPTGTGKSLVIGEFIRRVMDYPGQRVLKLTHVKELIEQNHEKLLKLWPTAPAGIYSAGLKRKESSFPITFAGIATAVKSPEVFGKIDLVVIDECHLLSPKTGSMYQRLLKHLRDVNPRLKVIGLTATHYRLGQGMLTDGGGLFTDVCVDMTTLDSFNWFIREGYLCPLYPKRTKTELDTSDVKIQHGEFNQKQLQVAVDRDEITYAALQETLGLSADRRHWLVFASGIQHSIHVRDMLESTGIAATCVHSDMATGERDRNIADFRAGKYQAMVNNGILTTGFDYPDIDLIVMLRPTQSPGLWVQMLGRGTRPVYAAGHNLMTTEGRLAAIAAGDKKWCIVLDFAGNTSRLGPINDPVVPRRRGKGTGVAPVKVCEVCGCYNHASVRVCIGCGAEFPKQVNIYAYASTQELIREDAPQVEIFPVERVVYRKHTKEGRPDSIRVSYFCGLRVFDEWICLSHEGFARKRARDWWRGRARLEPPESTAEGLTRLNELREPSRIRVWINKRHPEVLSYDYGDGFGTSFTNQGQGDGA